MFGKFMGEHLPLSPIFTYFWTPLQVFTCKFWEMLRIFHKTPVDGSHPADIYRGPTRHDFMSFYNFRDKFYDVIIFNDFEDS